MGTSLHLILILILNVIIYYANSAKILGVFPSPGYSQFILCESLMLELANRGHEVTVISAFEPKNKTENYKTVLVEKAGDFDLFGLESGNLFLNILTTYNLGYAITEATLKNDKVQKLLKSDEIFDLVIVEKFFCEALEGFAQHFNAPLVLFSSLGPTEWNSGSLGNPSIPSISTIAWTSYTRHMSFGERFVNLLATVFDSGYKHLVAYPTHQQFINNYFPKRLEIQEVIYNASLMLLNSHVTVSENAPMVYGMVNIGGFYIKQKPLEPNIKEFLDGAENGAIFFSLGSNLNSSDLSPEILTAILNTFKKLEQRILWKFEGQLRNKTDNLLISKWLKQPDILAHPNIQLFISHGGLLSTTESVFYGVPMLGIPIFGDQKMNMARAARGGFAKVLPLREITEESFFSGINETIYDPKYQENARIRSNVMRDQIARPMELAMHWIEYVLRHKGLHFKSPAADLYWFQLYMLDIFGAMLLCVCLITYVTRKIVIAIVNSRRETIVQRKRDKNVKNKKHKKQ